MDQEFLGGVVEGFYGHPWTPAQRHQLFDQMVDWGLNTYFYAPKDDLKHRAIWRENYTASELAALGTLITACDTRGLRFIYGLSPGLDMHFSDAAELESIKRRFLQLIEVGARNFALLFDDLPGEMRGDDREAYQSVAHAQCAVANSVFGWLRTRLPHSRMLFCPTPYCERMDRWQLGGADYLQTVGHRLAMEIDVLWTGPEIISAEIPVDSIQRLIKRIGRAPVIWDNLHANDYDLRRLYCGPYSGRSPELLSCVRGILSNPNNEFPINYIPLRTLAKCLHEGPDYQPRAAYLAAIAEWLQYFETVGPRISREDLTLLADCYYLPYADGPEANSMQDVIASLLDRPPDAWGDAHEEFLKLHSRIQRVFEGLTQLMDRELFYAWSRRIWELREELDLIQDYLRRKQAGEDQGQGIGSETHLLQTYRGGMVAKLQRRLSMDENGRFRSTRSPSDHNV